MNKKLIFESSPIPQKRGVYMRFNISPFRGAERQTPLHIHSFIAIPCNPVKTKLLIILLFLLVAGKSMASDLYQNETNNSTPEKFKIHEISKEGAWCWFADPRALHYENSSGTIKSTYVGYIDVHGNIKATQYDFITGISNEVLIRSYFQPDDHDNPSFLVLPDERIIIFYSRHTDEACFYYRISKNPGDITSLGKELKIITEYNTTYPSPFILSDDPTHFYLCWRGINWHPTIARYTIPDSKDKVNVDWGPHQMIQSTAARPYCKYYSNGKDKIYLAYTTGHPDNEYPNFTYFNYIDINTGQLKDVEGTVLSSIADGPHQINKTDYPALHPKAVVDNPENMRDWIWQTTLDKDGLPVIAMVQISKDKNTHNYYYAKWTGTEWKKTFLAHGGGHFHQSPGLELCYSGGMTIDDSNPNVIYCSVPVSGKSGSVYEIIKYTVSDEGAVTSSNQITSNSALNNIRPFTVANSGDSPLKLVWMHGNYYDWIVSSSYPKGFATSIYGDYALTPEKVNLANGLIHDETFDENVSGTAKTTNGELVTIKKSSTTIDIIKSESFSISLTPCLQEESYEGVILKMGNMVYGLNGSTMKPYVTIGDKTYGSTNLLGTSDSWQTQDRGTGGKWWSPVKLKYFNLTITYKDQLLTIYRNGLIDQVVDIQNVVPGDVVLGGFEGWIEDCKIYNRALNQSEIKKLSDTNLTK